MSSLSFPSDSTPEPLNLNPPAPVDVVSVEQVSQAVEVSQSSENSSFLPSISQDIKTQSKKMALSFTQDIADTTPRSSEFDEKLAEISRIGQTQIERTTTGPSRLLTTSLSTASRSKDDAQVRVAKTLGDLRKTVEELTPNGAGLSASRKILGIMPFGKQIDRYFKKYETSEQTLNAIVKSLLSGKDELQKDNASLEVEKQNLWKAMEELNHYILLTRELDAAVVQEATNLRVAGKSEEAQVMESDVLFAVRQRNQDLLTQLAVAVQGYLAMGLVQKNNTELIKGVDRARTTTLTALRTAVVVAKALANQELVLNQIEGVNATTNAMIEQTAALLRQNTIRVHEQASSSGVSVEVLQKAFDDVFATIEAIDSFKSQANVSMEKTIDALGTQLHRARPALERARLQEKDS